MEKQYPGYIKYSFFILSSILTIYAIIQVKNFLYPLAFGVLLSYLLYPVVNFLEKHHVPRVLAILFSIILLVITISGIFFFIYTQVDNMIGDFPKLRRKAFENIEIILSFFESFFGATKIEMEAILKQRVVNLFESGSTFFNRAFSYTTGTIIKAGLMPVYIFLFLYYRTKFAYFILKMVPERNKLITISILRDISNVVARYMGGVVIVVFILFFINSIGLKIIGLRFAVILGVMSALINFIPYFGTLLGATIPLVFALLTGDSPTIAIRVVFLFLIIQFIENNILTPNIVGSNVKISPFFIILGLIAGSFIWGIPGMLVIIPFLAMVKVICSHIESLKPYAFLLGRSGTAKHAITLKNTKFFIKDIKNIIKRK